MSVNPIQIHFFKKKKNMPKASANAPTALSTPQLSWVLGLEGYRGDLWFCLGDLWY
jgi:hypothetical protein